MKIVKLRYEVLDNGAVLEDLDGYKKAAIYKKGVGGIEAYDNICMMLGRQLFGELNEFMKCGICNIDIYIKFKAHGN